jgi:hypothetical protein
MNWNPFFVIMTKEKLDTDMILIWLWELKEYVFVV